MRRERVQDTMQLVQSARESLSDVDPSLLPDRDAIDECFEHGRPISARGAAVKLTSTDPQLSEWSNVGTGLPRRLLQFLCASLRLCYNREQGVWD